MQRMLWSRWLVGVGVLSLILLLSACIDVDDFGSYWEESGYDAELLGRWVPLDTSADEIEFTITEPRMLIMRVIPEKVVTKTVIDPKAASKPPTKPDDEEDVPEEGKSEEKTSDAVSSDEEKLLTRSLTRGNHHFLMMKEDMKDRGGTLHLYRFVQNRLVFYRPAKSQRKAFNATYAGRGVEAGKEQVRIPVLDAVAFNVLLDAAENPRYWEEASVYERAKGYR